MVLMSVPDNGIPLGAPHCHSCCGSVCKFSESQLIAAVVLARESMSLVVVVKVPGLAASSPRNRCLGSSLQLFNRKTDSFEESIVAPTGTGTVVHLRPACSAVSSMLKLEPVRFTASFVP